MRHEKQDSLEAPQENLCHYQNVTTQKTKHKIILGERMSYPNQQTPGHAHTWCCKARDMACWIFHRIALPTLACHARLWHLLSRWTALRIVRANSFLQYLWRSREASTQLEWGPHSGIKTAAGSREGSSLASGHKGHGNFWCSLHNSCRATAACLERVLVYNEESWKKILKRLESSSAVKNKDHPSNK